MNLHIVQSEEARAEAMLLMIAQENLISPRFGGPIIGGIHDHITGSSILSKEDLLIPKSMALQILGSINHTGVLPELFNNANGQPCVRGPDLLSLIIPQNIDMRFRNRAGELVVVQNRQIQGILDRSENRSGRRATLGVYHADEREFSRTPIHRGSHTYFDFSMQCAWF